MPTYFTSTCARGVCSLANQSVAYEETQSNRVSDFCDFVYSLGSKANPVWLLFLLYCSWYSTVAGVVPCGGRTKSPSYIIIVQVIFYFLWDHWAHPGYFENRILIKPAQGCVCSLANYIVAYEETQSKPSLWFLWFCVFFVSRDNRFWLILY